MKLARLGPPGEEIPVVLVHDVAFDLREITDDIDGSFLDADGPDLVRAALDEGRLPRLPSASELRIGSPIARPSAIVCIGLNYAAHAAESGLEPPTVPIVFLKTPNTMVGPDDAVPIPPNSTKTDWEVELGVVVKRRTYALATPADAAGYIAGYVVVNDVSERRFQIEESGGQWSKGKCAPAFTPTGPWLVTADEIDPTDLRIRSFVNGEPRQDSTTADLIFGVNHIIWHLSQYMALEPGDLVLTGTPEGVALSGRFPYLRQGDVVELEIDGLGAQCQRMS
jgi:2-keto-4-pentenoate hydratase/2-oxohepta-3-ene-1,7-dioic acid hydratase in catechol pathway